MYFEQMTNCEMTISTMNEKNMNNLVFSLSPFLLFLKHLDWNYLFSPIMDCPLMCVCVGVYFSAR